jgi:flagellar basal body rod protein FlgC
MSVSSIALSGLAAAEKRLANSANNIVNSQTQGFQPKDAVQSALNGGGVRVDLVDRKPDTVTVGDNAGNAKPLPNVSLEKEVVDAQIATYDFQANLQVLKKQKELDKSLLDIQA